MSRVKVTCEIHDYSEPSKPNIRIHSHWNEDTFVELEINDERYTVSAEEITRAIYNASNGGRGAMLLWLMGSIKEYKRDRSTKHER